MSNACIDKLSPKAAASPKGAFTSTASDTLLQAELSAVGISSALVARERQLVASWETGNGIQLGLDRQFGDPNRLPAQMTTACSTGTGVCNSDSNDDACDS